MNITIQITGAENIERKLNRLGSSIYILPDSFKQIGQFLANYYANDVFESRGQKLGAQWSPLAASTIRDKFRHYRAYTTVPLIRTGLMKRSFGFEATDRSVKIGNTTDYFKYHQLGTVNIPQRKMMGFNASIKQRISEIIKAELTKKIESA